MNIKPLPQFKSRVFGVVNIRSFVNGSVWDDVHLATSCHVNIGFIVNVRIPLN